MAPSGNLQENSTAVTKIDGERSETNHRTSQLIS
jgi:hypothetical protein